MADQADTTPETNSQTPTDQSASKDASPAPGSSDTSSAPTDPSTETPSADEGSLLNPKTDDAAADGEKTEDEPAANAALFGAPEEGTDYEITGLPEGVTLDKEALAAVTPLARELGLSNEGLSKLAQTYTEGVLPNVVKSMEADLANAAGEIRKGWATDARAAVQGGLNAAGETVERDPVYGGMSLQEVQQVSAKALDKLGGDGFRDFLDQHGLGNHPAMLRFAYQAGRAISEDTSFERGRGVPKAELTREEKYYGTK